MRELLAVLLLGCTACVSTDFRSRDWSTYDGPGARYFQAEEIDFPHVDDPLEPVNRLSAQLTYALTRWGLAPLLRVYRFILPETAREHLRQAGVNWMFPTRFLANLAQGKLTECGTETTRFVMNTTVGILGLFDPAQEIGLHPSPEDFGQAFADWGWRDSTYLYLPLLGPSTVRDGLGKVPDTLTDPATYLYPAPLARGFNALSTHVEADLRAADSAYDAYEYSRTLYMLRRNVDVEDFRWEQDDSGPTQTLQAIFLEPEDEGFADKADTRRVLIDATGNELPYCLWLQPGPAPLMYVVPGFGGNRLGNSTMALAEIGFSRGHSVVAVSSPTNWEFMRYGASVSVPGYGPVDAHDLHVALTAIDRDLERRLPGRFTERRLLGLSIGGFQTLLVAGNQQPGLLDFDLCVALNPPVDLEHALSQLDRFYNAPLAFPAAERADRIEQIFAKVLYLSEGKLRPGMELPFTEIESRFLIGMAFRFELQFLILQSQDLEDSGVLQTGRTLLHMAPAFREAAEFSYMEYFYAFALPYFAARDPDIDNSEEGARTMFARCDLRSLEGALRADERVRVFTNENDFVLSGSDLDWLRDTFGERLTLMSEGGHLGNLYRAYLKSVIGATLDEGAAAEPAGGRRP